MKKYILLLSAVFFILFFGQICGADNNISGIYLNGDPIQTDAVLKDGSTYVPVRAVFEALGCDVAYNAENKTAEIAYDEKSLSFSQNDGENITVNKKMYIPLRKVSEELGFEVIWDDENRSININSYGEYTNNPAEISLIDENSDFALRLGALMPDDKNCVFSPLGIKYALALLANGADSETKDEITSALGISDLDTFNDSVREYIDSLVMEEDDTAPEGKQSYGGLALNIANSVWFNKDHIKGGDFSDSYKKLAEDKYKAAARASESSSAAKDINDWCADATNNKITKIIDNGDFAACLVNAVYMNGKWAYRFDSEKTDKGEFIDRDGKSCETDFMHTTGSFDYYADSNIKMISMPYLYKHISMYIALLDNENIDPEKYIELMEDSSVNVSLPKFRTEFSFDAADVLKKMGITKAFDERDDAYHFKAMFNDTVNNAESIYVSDVMHRAYIDVDEEGTEAAAITALTLVGSMAVPEKVYSFTADRPFVYFIRDNDTGDILFMGKYSFV